MSPPEGDAITRRGIADLDWCRILVLILLGGNITLELGIL